MLLVIRSSEGEVRWMEVRELLRQASGRNQRPVKKIVFKGERFAASETPRTPTPEIGDGRNCG